MSRLWLLAVALLLSGCQHFVTQKRSNELISVVPNLYYQQVVDNLAMISASPGSLPFFGLPTQSTDTNTRQMNATYTPGWDFITNSAKVFGYLFDKQTAAVGGQLINAEAFQLQPISDPDKLTLIQIALRIAAGEPITSGEKYLFESFYILRSDTLPIYYYYYFAITHRCLDEIKCTKDCVDPRCHVHPASYDAPAAPLGGPRLGGQDSGSRPSTTTIDPSGPEALVTPDASHPASTPPPASPPPPIKRSIPVCPPVCPANDQQAVRYQKADWYMVCDRKKGVPKNACYVGRYRDKWVWVPAERQNELTGFTLAILDIASMGMQTAGRPTTTADASPALREFLAFAGRFSANRALNSDDVRMLNSLIEKLPQPEPPAPPQPLLPGRITPFPFPTPPGM